MRQGQQNRRGRGRNRKSQNPLSRNFESNGPDVKIRGTAAHIAEKYMSLARDASASGDSVMAENYLQHAEHYNRIIMAAQSAMQPSDPMNGMHRNRPMHEMAGDDDDDEGDDLPMAAGQAEHGGFQGQSYDREVNGSRGERDYQGHGREHRRDYREHRDGGHQRYPRPQESQRHMQQPQPGLEDQPDMRGPARYGDDEGPDQGQRPGGDTRQGRPRPEGEGGFRNRRRGRGPNDYRNGGGAQHRQDSQPTAADQPPPLPKDDSEETPSLA
jgi:hypothetical protein